MAAQDDKPTICVPMKLDAYVLDPSACGDFPNKATLAPLAQPNYTFLRLDSALIQPDVIPLHDLHNASPASSNPRVTNLGTGEPRLERQGVYLHWMLPRFYRSGVAEDKADDNQDLRAPQFRAPPDRWLVVRRLHPGSFSPPDVVQKGLIRELTAWVVESNRLRNIEDFGRDVDIELECAPYVTGSESTESLDGQAEVFVGRRVNLEDWREESNDPNKASQFIRLTVAGSANPLFADAVEHCPNVFSMLDNFSYLDANKQRSFLSKATASYYVIGWHANPRDDPFTNSGGSKSMSTTLNDIAAVLKQPGDQSKNVNINTWKSGSTMCHGAMYMVQYPAGQGSNVKVPAHDAAKKLADPLSHPVTVGATPLDSVMAYLRAHQLELDAKGVQTNSDLRETERALLAMSALILQQDDDVESQHEALDLLTANNFRPSQDNGSIWSFSSASSTGSSMKTDRTTNMFVPTLQQISDLARLNAVQAACDAANRQLTNERWNLFARWWQYVADAVDISRNLGSFQTQTKIQRDLVDKLAKRVARVKTLRDSLLATAFPLDNAKQRMVAMGSQSRFFLQKDPTILIPGINNPWPNDWMSPLSVRLSSQIESSDKRSGSLAEGWQSLNDFKDARLADRMPSPQHGSTARRLLDEFYNLHPRDADNDKWAENPASVVPLYHDHADDNEKIIDGLGPGGVGRDQWSGTQAWFPLFVEYEARYYHVPWDNWKFQDNVAIDPVPGNPLRTRYGVDPNKNIEGVTKDERVITGRVMILPQPGFNLSVNIQTLFQSTKVSDLPDQFKTVQQQKDFLTKVEQLQYLSAPMGGFVDHLTTRMNGTHVRPSVRLPGKPLAPLMNAITASALGGFDRSSIQLMDLETDKTPYANFVDFDEVNVAPLKPVVHGQFKFTKLDIYDKFGQVISAIDPAPAVDRQALLPALSEYYHPQHRQADPAKALTVANEQYGTCQHAQYPPSINQDARLNASFLSFDDGLKMWRPCTEWENPVWGYLVVNYAESALQVFLPTGEFYREVRFGGPKGTSEMQWQPFEPPKDRDLKSKHPQLDNLISKLLGPDYLRAFVQMINASLKFVPHTPDTYADFLNAIVGRPLALVNMGYSLELAAPPLKNQSTQSLKEEPLKVTDYAFTVKIGDKDRVYDGLVGYFEAVKTAATFGSELNLDKMFTYYPSDNASTQALKAERFPTANAYYVSNAEDNLAAETAKDDETIVNMAQRKSQEHWRQLKMLGVLIDPFAQLHLYTGILPIKSLQLPSWTLQNALQKMTAFFHMGPLLITTPNLQKQYDQKHDLTADYNLAAFADTEPDATDDKGPQPFKGVPIPAMASADWNWLQAFAFRKPAVDNATAAEKATVAAAAKEQHWNPFVVARMDNAPKFERGPYTAVEGFLQLKRPIMAPEMKKGG